MKWKTQNFSRIDYRKIWFLCLINRSFIQDGKLEIPPFTPRNLIYNDSRMSL